MYSPFLRCVSDVCKIIVCRILSSTHSTKYPNFGLKHWQTFSIANKPQITFSFHFFFCSFITILQSYSLILTLVNSNSVLLILIYQESMANIRRTGLFLLTCILNNVGFLWKYCWSKFPLDKFVLFLMFMRFEAYLPLHLIRFLGICPSPSKKKKKLAVH